MLGYSAEQKAQFAVTAPSGIVAPVVVDPNVDLAVDEQLKPEPLPSTTDEYLQVMPDLLRYEAGMLGGILERTLDLENASLKSTSILYLPRISKSKVYDVAIESPLDDAKKFNERLGVRMLLERKIMQPVGLHTSNFILFCS
ncbi:hypothetical protein M758_UG115500 [Ceratodon purpureus]|nr:hypothetical protein M758_UG115500 [Ceratodon purpureus]